MNDIATKAIDTGVEAALATRRSVRGFTSEPVPLDTVRRVLALASRAPSATNTQPWRVHVMTGAALEAFKAECVAAHAAGQHWPSEYPYDPPSWPSPYIERRRQLGWALYGLLGIAKGDRAASALQHRRNFAFFGAPVGMIVTIGRQLTTGSYIDVGMFVQSILIAARGFGLDTCAQAAFINMHPIIRRRLALPEDQVVVCGIALGHADPAEPANALQTIRVPVDEFTTFHA